MGIEVRKVVKKNMLILFCLALIMGPFGSILSDFSAIAHADSPIIYVKENGSDSKDGTSWGDAFATLQKALEEATNGTQIWVAAGTYYPTKDTLGSDNPAVARTKTFQMKDGVAIYGGFKGDETLNFNLNNRNFATNETILSGDLETLGDNSDNAYHVIYNEDISDTAILDGVTITEGNADRGTNDSDHPENSGGGIFNLRSSPTIKNVQVMKNEAGYRGGGIFNHDSSPYLENVTVANNEVKENRSGNAIPSGGGGMNNFGESEVVIKASIFKDNTSANDGGGISNGDHYSSVKTKVSNLHLIDVVVEGNKSPFGGGIMNTKNGTVTMDGGGITQNNTLPNYSGGGIYNQYGKMILNEVSITANKAGQGAGVFVSGLASSVTINNGVISSNEAENTDGAGIHIEGQATVNIIGTKIENNHAKVSGGGIYINGHNGANVIVKGVLLEGNIAGKNNIYGNGNGGGIHNTRSASGGILQLEDTVIKENESKGRGGGLASLGGNQTLNRVVISDNESGSYGGGVYNGGYSINDGGIQFSYQSIVNLSNVQVTGNKSVNGGGMYNTLESSPTLTNVTIAGNSAVNKGGAMFNQASPGDTYFPDMVAPVIHNSIIRGTFENIDAVPVIAHSLVEGSGGSGASWNGDFGTDNNGNLDVDPKFVDGDYRLSAESPAINAGSDALVLAGVTTDLDENMRIFGAAVDMGAYEFGSTPPPVAGGDVTAIYVDENDHVVAPEEVHTGNVGDAYTTVAKNITGYTLTATPANATGTFTADIQEVKYVYKKNPVSGGGGGGGSGYVPSNDSQLESLHVSGNGEPVKLTPTFSADVFDYQLETDAEKILLTLKTANNKAKVYMDGEEITDSLQVELEEGDNVLTIIVKAENGSEKRYTLTIHHKKDDVTEPVVSFTDIAGHWAEEFILQGASDGIIKGFPDGTFKPNQDLTRVQTASLIVRALGLETDKTAPFSDIGGYAAETQAEVEAAYHYNIIRGYSDGTFKPSKKVTRAQMALMLNRAYNQQKGMDYIVNDIAPYSDLKGYDEETVNAITMLYELGIATGSDGKYMPIHSATRAHAAKMLVNFLSELE